MEVFIKRAKSLRKNASDVEKVMWRHLRNWQQGVKFRRQQPLGPYIVDFVCFEKRLVIEIDGGQHQEQIDYDNRRTDWLGQQGYQVLRFWNNQVLPETDAVLEVIQLAINSYHSN